MAAVFQGVELYRSLQNLIDKDRAWCDANKASVVDAYQKWSGYPESPVLTADYPYQLIYNEGGNIYFYGCKSKIYLESGRPFLQGGYAAAYYNGSSWINLAVNPTGGIWPATGTILQANNPVYTTSALTTVAFAKTTPAIPPPISPLIYSGTNEAFSDTGLAASTQYYYKIFAKYLDGEEVSYSDGVMVSETTDVFVNPYQDWTTYPDSPELTSAFPYQAVGIESGSVYLFLSKGVMYHPSTALATSFSPSTNSMRLYKLVSNAWSSLGDYGGSISFYGAITQANMDIYTTSALTTVYFAKTT